MVRENGSGGHPRSDITVTNHDFEGGPLACIQMDGQAWFMAKAVGDRLGYASDGRKLVTKITGDWLDELEEGVDFFILKNGRLKSLKKVIPDSGTTYAPSLMLLSREGVNMVCMLSKKPVGKRMRRWLASDVLPAIQDDGKYEVRQAPAPQQIPEDPKLMRERRLAAKEQRLDRESKSKHLLMITAELSADLAPEVVRALKVQAVEIATGLKLPQLCAEDAESWYTAEQLLEPHDLHPNSLKGVLNLIKKEAGLTLRGDRTYMRTATTSVSTGDGGQKTVKQTQWTDEGKALIDKWAPVYARRKDMKLLPEEALNLQPSA